MALHSYTVRLHAEALDRHGRAVAFFPSPRSGQVRLGHIPGLLPGEEADVLITNESRHSTDAFGLVQKRHVSSSHRVLPTCPAYGPCGGCSLQHMDYAFQLEWKRSLVHAVLKEHGVFLQQGQLADCVPAPHFGLGGRRYVKFVAARSRSGMMLGAYAPNTHQLVDTTHCTVVDDALRKMIPFLIQGLDQKKITAYDERTRMGCLRYVLLRKTIAEQIQIVWVVADVRMEPELRALSAEIKAAHPNVVSIVEFVNDTMGNALLDPMQQGNCQEGMPFLEECMNGVTLRYSAGSFMQANAQVAASLYQTAAQFLAPVASDHLLDLYCGVGGIGLTVLHQQPGLYLTGIEENPAAVQDARASLVDPTRALFYHARSDEMEKILAWQKNNAFPPVSMVSVNPPRKGCSLEVLRGMIAQHPRKIVYVSCELTTLANDLAFLSAHGYQVTRVVPHDLHPHTPHIENVALLERV